MGWLRKTAFRLQPVFLKKKIEAELTDEIRTHLEMQTEANVAAGMDPEEARFAALRQFGGVDQIKERFRDERGVLWIEDFLKDLRYAVRQLSKAPGFAAISILTVAIGIGACTAMFSIVNGVLLRPLPYPDSNRIAVIVETMPPKTSRIPVAPATYLAWVAQQSVFEEIGMARGIAYLSKDSSGGAVRIGAQEVTANYFSAFDLQPVIGRTFRQDEELPGKNHVALLSYDYWRIQYGGRADVLGGVIRLNDQPYSIVGVVPKMSDMDWATQVFTPIAFTPSDRADYGSHKFWAIGLLKPGVSLVQAQSQMRVINDRIAQEHPDTNRGLAITVVSLLERLTGYVRPQLLVLLGGVGFLLLIACGNVTSLTLARASARQKEIVIRIALGASRGRIIRQFLCESLLLAASGGCLGVMLAYGSVGPLVRLASHFTNRVSDASVNGSVLMVACGLMLVAGLGVGLAPGLQATREGPLAALKESARGSSRGSRQRRARTWLVTAQIALALILLAGAGLLTRTLLAMERSNEGFAIDGIYSGTVQVSAGKNYATPQKVNALAGRILDRAATLPQVKWAAFTTGLPMGHYDYRLFATSQMAKVPPSALPRTAAAAITPGYFKVMSIPLIRGRLFNEQDTPEATPVAIISRTMADKYFPGSDPLGQRVMLLTAANTPDVWRQVVGIAGDVRPQGPRSGFEPEAYVPFAQQPAGVMTLVLRTTGPAADLSAVIRDIVHAADPDIPFDAVYPYTATIAYAWVSQQFSVMLFSIFAGIALLLAAIGIYGIMAYSVNQRTNEIGIRMALGAKANDVFGLILSDGARIVGLGLLIGMAGAFAFTRLLRSLLFDTSPNDPLTLAAVGVLLAFVAFLACWVPARRATKVDPIVALRSE